MSTQIIVSFNLWFLFYIQRLLHILGSFTFLLAFFSLMLLFDKCWFLMNFCIFWLSSWLQIFIACWCSMQSFINSLFIVFIYSGVIWCLILNVNFIPLLWRNYTFLWNSLLNFSFNSWCLVVITILLQSRFFYRIIKFLNFRFILRNRIFFWNVHILKLLTFWVIFI